MGLSITAQQLLDAIPDSAAVLDGAGTIVATNVTWRSFATDNGGSPDSTDVGTNYVSVCRTAAATGSHDAQAMSADLMEVLLAQAVERQYEYECGTADYERWFRTRVTLVAESPRRVLVTHLNITREKRAEQSHRQEAETDLLTGLLNWRGLGRLVGEQLAGRDDGTCHGVIYLDLDGFKAINDRLGHFAGDELLQVVASRLRRSVKADDLVARLGGDEFAVIAEVNEPGDLVGLAARVCDVIREPVQLSGDLVEVGASSGWQVLNEDDNVRDAIHNADIEMLADKRRRKNVVLPPDRLVLPPNLSAADLRTNRRG